MKNLDKDEWQIASRFLFVDLTLKVIDRDLKMLKESSPFKISEPYITLLERTKKIGTAERKALKKKMYQENIGVVQNKKEESFTYYLFSCKGAKEERSYFNPNIKKKVENILDEWMKQDNKMA
ncbi:hypothetical protein F9U64_01070 [Gracilibacillus oryzae]|uniref:Uncharacterized protein n=1 Tax=Gracilibacillus oryzae TaxID=1672701 RepID=A0A7C8GVG5_9BACI|nr:hypothetical protein [Gracilibacillus oryzae]KAB8139245.1 hypothetical protein F9U64_01070 [Gracilibacillus oryzae]